MHNNPSADPDLLPKVTFRSTMTVLVNTHFVHRNNSTKRLEACTLPTGIKKASTLELLPTDQIRGNFATMRGCRILLRRISSQINIRSVAELHTPQFNPVESGQWNLHSVNKWRREETGFRREKDKRAEKSHSRIESCTPVPPSNLQDDSLWDFDNALRRIAGKGR